MVDLDVRRLTGAPPLVPGVLVSSLRRIAAWPLMAQVGALYVLSRVVTTALFLGVGMRTAAASQGGAGKDLLTQLLTWDSGWYQRIAFDGYPSAIPEVGGQVQANAWAFLPLYPFTAKLLAFGDPALWPIVAVLLSSVCGLVATMLLAKLVRGHASDRHAVTAAVIFAFGPTAFILETAYAEAMGLMLLFLLLLLVDRGRYWTAALVALPLAFTRPGMQAVALFIGLHLVVRFVQHRRGERGLTVAEGGKIVALGAVTAALGFVWPVIAGIATGRSDAYLATEIAWRVPFTGKAELGAFKPWPLAFNSWFGTTGLLLLAAFLIICVAALTSRQVRALGSTVGLFSAAWLVYLFAVFFPQSSTFRLLMPLAPLGGAVAPRTKLGLIGVAVFCVLLQGFWMFHCYGAPANSWSAP